MNLIWRMKRLNRFALVAMTGLIAVLMLSGLAHTFSKCGVKTFFLGSGAIYAAMSGMCDE